MDFNAAEDDFFSQSPGAHLDGPGCPIADAPEDDDHSGDSLDNGEMDEAQALPPPIYGVDQTKGPLNEAAAISEYHRRVNAGWDQ